MQQEPSYHMLPPDDDSRPARLTPPGKSLAPDLDRQDANADLSHELRTSLAIITLLSGNLDLLYEQLDDRKRHRMIRDIRKHTQKINDLIGEVLQICNDPGPVTM
jgi:signal transduction histidine kinase